MCALEAGNWRDVLYVIYPQVVGEAQGQAARLLSMVHAITRGMRWRALGQVVEAWAEFGDAARMLPTSFCPTRDGQAIPLAVLAPAPEGDFGHAMLTWRAAQTVVREQQDLLALRALLVKPGLTLYEVLVYAYADYRRWVEDDPWTWLEPSADTPSVVRNTPMTFCARATRIRRFGRPFAADVDPAALRRAKGLPGLYADTMRYLAAAAAPAEGIPPRLGWTRAHELAIRWLDDVEKRLDLLASGDP
ncbi:hypothetical protein [Pseudonocardia charpentierae]|uniref:Uncharacterized protein n=1 Tax=Pseudonocardia charpentierae TaxID=3075545 RepID=A0ABU2N8B3_9PSEU|nr:hypothetical protein [Pseudonocardia sp. DSM 45834]MDT0349529.1 hypothetical protein [Pseudonocardia sp. DSM 45834]